MKVAYVVAKQDEMGNRIYRAADGAFERSLKNAELHEHPFGLEIRDDEKRVRIFIGEEE